MGLHERVVLLDVEWVEASVGLIQVRDHSASCDVCEACDVMTECSKENPINTSNDMLLEGAVGGDPLAEDAQVGGMGASDRCGVGNGYRGERSVLVVG